MNNLNRFEKDRIIKESSPLFEFWCSSQCRKEDTIRKLKLELELLDNQSLAVDLYKEEPYKWEVLYISTINLIIQLEGIFGGIDQKNKFWQSALKSILILMSVIKEEEIDRSLEILTNSELISPKTSSSIKETFQSKYLKLFYLSLSIETRPVRFLFVLWALFSNRYRIAIKYKPRIIYEVTALQMIKLNHYLGYFTEL